MTPKQRVLKKYPTARSERPCGWLTYVLIGGRPGPKAGPFAYGSNPKEAWANAAKRLPKERKAHKIKHCPVINGMYILT